jgi:hypothetical protein
MTWMDIERNDRTREGIATYVARVVVRPSGRRGKRILNGTGRPLRKDYDRPERRSRAT